jgi:hypothetical protein
MTAVVLTLSLACLAQGNGQTGRPSDESLRNTVRLEYPKALRNLEAFYARATGEVLATERRPLSKNSSVTTRIHRFASAAPDVARVTVQRVVEGSDQDKWPAAVFCRNKGYSFILRKTPPRAEFALELLAKDENDKRQVAAMLLSNLEAYLNAPFSVTYHSVRWLAERPEFSIRSVAETARGAERALSVDFDCPIESFRGGGYEGKLVVLPDKKWVVAQFEYRAKKRGNIHKGEIEYEGASGGFPIPKRVTHSHFEPGGRTPMLVNTYEFKNMRFEALPEKEFTLSAFGLPEVAP